MREQSQIRIKILKISTGRVKYSNIPLDIETLNDVQSKLNVIQGDYQIVQYTIF